MKKVPMLCALPILWLGFVLLLGFSANIPQSAIANNMEKTAQYYADKPSFQLPENGDHSSLIHNYADAMLFNIIWNIDCERPFSSALDARFHKDLNNDACSALKETVLENALADASYARYWHGSTALLRPLLMVTDVQGIKIICAAVMAALALAIFFILIKRRLWLLVTGLMLGGILTKIWVVPMCLEYVPPFVLTEVFCLLILLKNKEKPYFIFFLVMGSLICFFDFLTCEILTLFVPLILLLTLKYKNEKDTFSIALKEAIGCAMFWLLGYALTFFCKWVLVAVVFKSNIFDIVLAQGINRAVGDVVTVVGGEAARQKGFPPINAILVNLGRMFPMSIELNAGFISMTFLGICFLIFCTWFLLRKKQSDHGVAGVILLLGFAPFARYVVLFNHALLHPFMTYRDLFITVLAVTVFLSLTCKLHLKKGGGNH